MFGHFIRAILEIDPCALLNSMKTHAASERRQTSLLLPLQLLFSLFQDEEGWILRDSEMTFCCQIIVFRQPRLPWNKGVSFTKQLFGVKTRVKSRANLTRWRVETPIFKRRLGNLHLHQVLNKDFHLCPKKNASFSIFRYQVCPWNFYSKEVSGVTWWFA